MMEICDRFGRYTQFGPKVPVWCVSPAGGAVSHRFFDTSPISPSGRYLAATRFPFEDHLPSPGDPAEVLLVDLATGEDRVVAETRGWDTQLGAQVQWGPSDAMLFFNDMDVASWRPFGVRLDPLSGSRRDLEGTVYMASPDGTAVASPCLLRTAVTQEGYGVVVPPECVPANRGAADDDGVYVTDTQSGECRLLVSFGQVLETARPGLDPAEYADGDFYGAHVKYSPRGDRILLVLRWMPHDPSHRMRANVVTMRADGSEIHVAVSHEYWGRGGHHPNWCPDGRHVMMNLKLDGRNMRLVRAPFDGGRPRLMSESAVGSGHPSLHRDGRHVLTDAYPGEPVAFGDGTVPIRLIDLDTGRDRTLVRIRTQPDYEAPKRQWRVDPHPAWDYDFRRVAFNACPDGGRKVFVADLFDVVQ